LKGVKKQQSETKDSKWKHEAPRIGLVWQVLKTC
jgi:hypothetical protein